MATTIGPALGMPFRFSNNGDSQVPVVDAAISVEGDLIVNENPGVDSLGNPLPINFDSYPQTYGYDGSDNLTTITVTAGADVYVQTLTYTGSNLTGASAWVKQ